MATCVRDICPLSELYIARLDESGMQEPTQKFTIASCTKALRWALDECADIISMSWTYEKKTSDNDKTEFETLVKNTVDCNRAVLFGSLPDLGPNFATDRFVPVGLDNVVRISSATPSGAVSDSNFNVKSDFLLPGEETRDVNGELTLKGSSYATAYAAGLAALVLYTFRTLEVLGSRRAAGTADVKLAREALQVARKPVGMKYIFEALTVGDPKKGSLVGPFVQPSQVLRAPEYPQPEQDIATLRDIVNTLVTSKVKRELLGAS